MPAAPDLPRDVRVSHLSSSLPRNRLDVVARLWGLGACLALAGCDTGTPSAEALPTPIARTTALATGAGISGANGLHFSADGRLHVASVLGSEIVILDPETGRVLERLTAADGVVGPDDVAFGPDGSMFWTSILTGEVAGFTPAGERVVAAQLSPGVNPITFSPDGRLFVAQCFFGDALYEVDPHGQGEPRLIADDLGPGCGLNGMDWGGDGRLYGPRWFHGEVVSIDVATGERRLEAEGFEVPAAVKFDSRGRLHVLDTGAGRVVRIAGEERTVVADLVPGLDNIAFDRNDRLFVSSFTDGFVWRVEDGGSPTELSPGGMAHPGGVTVLQDGEGRPQVMVADLHALRGFDPQTGKETLVQRNILGVSELGSVLSVTADGDNLLLTSFTENNVRVWNPREAKTVARYDDLAQPVSATRYRAMLAVAEHGTGRVIGLVGNTVVPLAENLPAPTDLATDGDSLYVSDRERGEILEIARAGSSVPPLVVASGLVAPEGLAWTELGLVVVEGESGRVLQVTGEGDVRLLAMVAPGTSPTSDAQPPSVVLNDVAAMGSTLFATGETNRVLYRIDLDAKGQSHAALPGPTTGALHR